MAGTPQNAVGVVLGTPEPKIRASAQTAQQAQLAELARAVRQTVPGVRYLRAHLEGKTITRMQAMLAKCAECSVYYEDGAVDCRNPICPLYPWMPYRRDADNA
jgi:hypothetical protein